MRVTIGLHNQTELSVLSVKHCKEGDSTFFEGTGSDKRVSRQMVLSRGIRRLDRIRGLTLTSQPTRLRVREGYGISLDTVICQIWICVPV
jgi:hypothetical protein